MIQNGNQALERQAPRADPNTLKGFRETTFRGVTLFTCWSVCNDAPIMRIHSLFFSGRSVTRL